MENIGSIMTPGVVTVEATDPLGRARDLMRERRISHLPVTHHGALVGVLSRRDLWELCGEGAGDRTASRLAVQGAMSAPATTLAPGSTIAWAAAVLQMQRIGCIPIVQDGRLVGIVTRTDLESVIDPDEWARVEDEPRRRSREWE